MIRDAAFSDIPGIVAVLLDGYGRSHYAGSSVNVDVKEAKRLLVQCIQRHGSHNGGGTFVQVADRGGRVTAVIVGTLARVYVIGDRLMATDLLWLAAEDAEPGDAVALMRNLVAWAKGNPAVSEIRCGATAIIGDPARAGRILESMGMQPYGQLFRMESSQ